MKIIGHRGAKGLEPENTLKSVQKAIDLGLSMIEIDVHFCKDEVVVIHYRTLDETTDAEGFYLEKTYEELKSIDAGNGESIPTLKQVLQLIAGHTEVNIEIKETHSLEKIVRVVDEALKNTKLKEEDILFSSFDHQILAKVREVYPDVRIGVLTNGKILFIDQVVSKLSAYSVNSKVDFVDKDWVEQIHASGAKSFVYTVNIEEDFKRLKSYGVDGIFTDFPDKFC